MCRNPAGWTRNRSLRLLAGIKPSAIHRVGFRRCHLRESLDQCPAVTPNLRFQACPWDARYRSRLEERGRPRARCGSEPACGRSSETLPPGIECRRRIDSRVCPQACSLPLAVLMLEGRVTTTGETTRSAESWPAPCRTTCNHDVARTFQPRYYPRTASFRAFLRSRAFQQSDEQGSGFHPTRSFSGAS